MEQLQKPQPLVELDQWGHRVMAEPGVGRFGQPPQLALAKAIAGEKADDAGREIGVGQPFQRGEVELRQRLGHIEPAILGEAGQQHVLEGMDRGLRAWIAGGKVAHRAIVTYRLDKAIPAARLERRRATPSVGRAAAELIDRASCRPFGAFAEREHAPHRGKCGKPLEGRITANSRGIEVA